LYLFACNQCMSSSVSYIPFFFPNTCLYFLHSFPVLYNISLPTVLLLYQFSLSFIFAFLLWLPHVLLHIFASTCFIKPYGVRFSFFTFYSILLLCISFLCFGLLYYTFQVLCLPLLNSFIPAYISFIYVYIYPSFNPV
jgi:hypothetical protein